MKKFVFLLSAVMIILGALPSYALMITVIDANDQPAIDEWINNLGGLTTVLEDFEDETAGWYDSLVTGVGTFTAEGAPGTGSSSYTALTGQRGTKFSIHDYETDSDAGTDWYGRTNTTENGSQWLDSGDITKLVLTNINASLTNLFFYISDPSDVSALTTINGYAVSSNFSETFWNLDNGTTYFIGITLAEGEVLNSITWTTSTANDGYGLDDFSTVTAPVPEPATILLLGIGLLGIAGTIRKKK